MNETDAWNSFLISGSVLDYLQYKAIQQAQRGEPLITENKDENKDKRTDNKGTELR